MTLLRSSVLLVAFALAPAFAQAETIQFLPAKAADQVPSRLVAAKRITSASLDREPASFAWALDPSAPIEKAVAFTAESREYWKRVDAQQLAAGVAFSTSAEGAVLRLSPVSGAAKRGLDPATIEIRYAGRRLQGAAAIEQLADAGRLKAAGLGYPEGTIAFRLKPELGAGEFELVLPESAGDVLLHVFEPKSTERLTLQADRSVVLTGGDLRLEARFESAQGKRLGELVATVAAPNGRLFDLGFAPQSDGRWLATTRIDAAAGVGEGLWEVHATGLSRDGLVQRDVRTTFDAVIPAAKLGGRADIVRGKDGGLNVTLPIEVASASRYNVSGLLYGTDANGQMRPFAIAHAAAWAEAGTTSIGLQFGRDLLQGSALSAPFELRDLELTDFATRGLVERRARALRFELR
jgi:hypothetical protein